MTASHRSRTGALTPLFSVISSGRPTRRSDIDAAGVDRIADDGDEVIEIVDAPEEPVDAVVVPPVAATREAAPHQSVNSSAAMNEPTPAPIDPDLIAAQPAVAQATAPEATAPSTAEAATPHVAPTASAVPAVAGAHLPAVPATDEGLPLSLDVFAVTARAVLVLIGSSRPAEQIAKTAIGLSIESEQTAAIDTVVPRAIDLVLYRAKALITAGIAPNVVEDYETRYALWRRLSLRSGLEPAAIVLSLAPFPPAMIASMLRVSLADVSAAIERWHAGIDPDPSASAPALRPAQIAAPQEVRHDSTDDVSNDHPGVAAAEVAEPAAVAEPSAVTEPAKVAESVAPTIHVTSGDGEGTVPEPAQYAAASAVASQRVTGADRAAGNQHSADVITMNEDALDAFLGLPEGPASRLRQALRRRRH